MEILTIRDIADQAGVSIATVSRVLNNRPDVSPRTREKVLKLVRERNYTQNNNARNLKQRYTDFVCVIVRGRYNYFLSDVAERILDGSRGQGEQYLLEYIDETTDEFETARRLYAERKLSGIIFLGSNIDGREREISELKLPCVFSTVDASALSIPGVCSVSVDNRAAGRKAVQELVSLGHRRIAVFGGRRDATDGLGLRYQGVVDCLRENGLALDESLYVETPFSLAGGYRAALSLLDRRRDFTAVFAMADIMAIGVSRALRERGLSIPGDVSLLGFDGIELASYVSPALATMRQDAAVLARQSVALMNEAIGQLASRHVLVDTGFVPGGSIGPAREA